jgi:hypothetical protein
MSKLKRIYSNEKFIVVINTSSLTFVQEALIREAIVGWNYETGPKEIYVTCNLETGGLLYKLLKSLDI